MCSLLKPLRNCRPGLIALVVFAKFPMAVEAAGIGYRNDTNYPVYVQGSIVINGKIRRGQLLFVRPGQTVWDVNLPTGLHTLSVYSPNNMKLYENVHPFSGTDLYFSIAPMMVPNGQPGARRSEGTATAQETVRVHATLHVAANEYLGPHIRVAGVFLFSLSVSRPCTVGWLASLYP